jgi:aminopeptidase N
MLKIKAIIFLWLTLFASPLVAQRLKLYKDFESKSNVEQFNHNKQSTSYRLYNATYPLRYDLALTTRIHVADFQFSGQVRILLHARDNTNSITLHSKMQIINSVLLARADGSMIDVQYELELATEFLTVTITETDTLQAGSNYTLTISYDGQLRTDDGGFYRSSYLDETGVRQ